MDITSLYNPNSAGKFPDPFVTPSNQFIPKTLDTALDLGLLLYNLNPTYRRASIRVYSHFINDIDIVQKGMSKAQKDDHYDLLVKGMNIETHLQTMGQDHAAFGNSMWRLHYPFKRWLLDRRSGSLRVYARSAFPDGQVKYDHKSMQYEVPDPVHPGKTVNLDFMDRADTDATKIVPRPLDVTHMFILYSDVSGKSQYIYKFPPDLLSDIHKGMVHQVDETPRDMLQAIANDQDFLFKEGEVFHFKAPTISGMNAKGWGIPETLLNYRSLHQLQIYRKIDEQVGLDYMLPFRLFSPNFGQNITDTALYNNLGIWSDRVQKLIDGRRKDPTKMAAFPFPVNYQEFGAEGKNLVPKDLIQYQENSMLDSMGYPAELFRASLQVQQVPTAVRLFEKSFLFIYTGFDRFIGWVSDRVRLFQGMDLVQTSLQLPSMADDLEARNVYLQLAAGGEISRAKAYSGFGIKDPVAEIEERAEEDIAIQKSIQEKQEAAEREQMGSMNDQLSAQNQAAAEQAGQAPGGAPPGGLDMNVSDSNPAQVMQKAEGIAVQLLQIEDDGQRAKEMNKIRGSNETLFSAVKQKMEELRSQASSQGRAQVGQMVGGQ